MTTTNREIGGLLEELDHLVLDRRLGNVEGVHTASARLGTGSLTVEYDEMVTTPVDLRRQIEACGFRCDGEMMPRNVCRPAKDARASDRPGAHRRTAEPSSAHAEMAHKMGHGAGYDRAAMVRDMRNRFADAAMIDEQGILTVRRSKRSALSPVDLRMNPSRPPGRMRHQVSADLLPRSYADETASRLIAAR